MDLNEAIFRRRAVRRFSPRRLEPRLVEELLQAAVQAPSALNLQPWAFGVFHGHDLLRDFSVRAKRHLVATLEPAWEMCARAARYEDPGYDLFHGADTLIVIYAVRGRLNPAGDCCLAAQNLMLAAHGKGLGTCPVGFACSWLNLPEIKREFDVAESYTAVFPLVVGHPEGTPDPVPRRAPEIVSWRWVEPKVT
jgi:nitroreductase